MLFDPTKVPEGTSILKHYKELARHKEFRKDPGVGIDNTKLMQYIFCVYDRMSPYRKKYTTDILKRKLEACHDSGFEAVDGGNFASPVEDFLRGNNKIVNAKIIEFVRMHRNYKYAYQITLETSYYNLMLEIAAGETKNLKEMKSIQADLEENLLDMLNQDNNPYLKDAMLRYMEDERLNLRPEDIAKKQQDGEQPLVN